MKGTDTFSVIELDKGTYWLRSDSALGIGTIGLPTRATRVYPENGPVAALHAAQKRFPKARIVTVKCEWEIKDSP